VKQGTVLEQVHSASWPGARAGASVLVATHNRAGFLPGLLDALAAQTLEVEVVIADDGSTDGTWACLQDLTASTSLPMLCLRLEHTAGPSLPRNTAAAHARTDALAITDDDCLPESGWAAAIARALAGGAGVVQGHTRPADDHHGPWDRAVSVREPSGLFETCNIGFPRRLFIELGGFPTFQVLADLPRGFGEDVVFGVLATRAQGLAWAGDAVVVHRWIPTSYRQHLAGVRRLTGFAWLARELPEIVERMPLGVFLSRNSATFDLAVASVALAAVSRRPSLVLGASPWLRRRLRGIPPGRHPAVRFAQLAVSDAVALVSLIEGSVRHRRTVL